MVLRTRNDGRKGLQAAIDRLLLLHVHGVVAEAGGGSLGATLLQKIVFQAKIKLRARGVPDPSWTFRRWLYGPYSPELVADQKALQDHDLLAAGHLSLRGKAVLDLYVPALHDANKAHFDVIREEASKRARWSATKAKREAYELRVGDPATGAGTISLLDAPIGIEFDLDPHGQPRPFAFDDEFLAAELQMELSFSPSQVHASRSFTSNSSRGVRTILGRGP